MRTPLHLTSGDIAGKAISEAGLPDAVFVWHDVLYDGPRCPGWPDAENLEARAAFLEAHTGGGLDRARILTTLQRQYRVLREAREPLVLWFDACLFDQSMLVHLLACLAGLGRQEVELLCVDAFPGINPFHGLGQLTPPQLASLYDGRREVGEAQFRFAEQADVAFARKDVAALQALSRTAEAPLPWLPAAAARWLEEQPDERTGLGRLETLALAAIREGKRTPAELFAAVAAADTPPQFWGDTTLWAKINALADRTPPLVGISGPAPRLPQWTSPMPLASFTVDALPRG